MNCACKCMLIFLLFSRPLVVNFCQFCVGLMLRNVHSPFIVGFFDDLSKPTDLAFLEAFIDEFEFIKHEGCIHELVTYPVNISCFIRDAPTVRCWKMWNLTMEGWLSASGYLAEENDRGSLHAWHWHWVWWTPVRGPHYWWFTTQRAWCGHGFLVCPRLYASCLPWSDEEIGADVGPVQIRVRPLSDYISNYFLLDFGLYFEFIDARLQYVPSVFLVMWHINKPQYNMSGFLFLIMRQRNEVKDQNI